jgi:hypothetical protein
MFGSVLIISFDIKTYVLSFQYHRRYKITIESIRRNYSSIKSLESVHQKSIETDFYFSLQMDII